MGRRAKNKQAAPEPLLERAIPSDKKLGKRKQEPVHDTRPSKKVKAKESVSSRNSRNKLGKVERKKLKDYDSEGEGSGWDDVEDEEIVDHKGHDKVESSSSEVVRSDWVRLRRSTYASHGLLSKHDRPRRVTSLHLLKQLAGSPRKEAHSESTGNSHGCSSSSSPTTTLECFSYPASSLPGSFSNAPRLMLMTCLCCTECSIVHRSNGRKSVGGC